MNSFLIADAAALLAQENSSPELFSVADAAAPKNFI
jgi:hypothetical protein